MSEGRQALSEQDFQAQITELARITGWQTMHVRRTVGRGRRWVTGTSRNGWPDMCLWRPDRFLLAELKTDTGALTREQTALLDSLRLAGVEVHVWRPAMWDQIEDVLTAHRKSASIDADKS